jgi:hypothetical protein
MPSNWGADWSASTLHLDVAAVPHRQRLVRGMLKLRDRRCRRNRASTAETAQVVRLHHVRGIASVSELKKSRAKSRVWAQG